MRRLLKLAERIGQPIVLRYEPRRGRNREEQGFPKFGSGRWSVAIDQPTTDGMNDKRKMRGLGAGQSRREAVDNAERAVEAMLTDEALGFTRAEFPDGLAIEWDDGAGEALVRAEADMRGLDIHDLEGLLGATP